MNDWKNKSVFDLNEYSMTMNLTINFDWLYLNIRIIDMIKVSFKMTLGFWVGIKDYWTHYKDDRK